MGLKRGDLDRGDRHQGVLARVRNGGKIRHKRQFISEVSRQSILRTYGNDDETVLKPSKSMSKTDTIS
jgi:hypothetical protein